jgi:uncharacterized membrane protein
MSGKQLLRLALLAPFGLAYIWLGHQASIASNPPLASLLIGLAPLAFSAVALAWQARSIWLIGLCVATLGLILSHLGFLTANAAWVYFIQHAGTHALLGLMFGRTLRGPDAEALCSKVSQFVFPGQLDADYYRYTWWVTLAWTLYFGLASLLSVLLFWLAPIEIWSVYANLLTPLIIGAIFAIEFAIRLRVLPRNRHASIAQTIRAYREYSQRRP